jgi:hypothetical protein
MKAHPLNFAAPKKLKQAKYWLAFTIGVVYRAHVRGEVKFSIKKIQISEFPNSQLQCYRINAKIGKSALCKEAVAARDEKLAQCRTLN